jgi:hypothetical protein
MLTLLKQEGVIVRAGKNGENIAIKRRAQGGTNSGELIRKSPPCGRAFRLGARARKKSLAVGII